MAKSSLGSGCARACGVAVGFLVVFVVPSAASARALFAGAKFPAVAANRVVAADLNRDGAFDLLAGSGDVNVLLGNGDGTFQDPTSFPVAGTSSMELADLDGDALLDVVTVDGVDVSVLLGRGDGSFAPALIFRPGRFRPVSVVAADLDGDDIPELVTGNQEGHVGVYRGNGDGTFQSAELFGPTAFSSWVAVAVADFDGDLLTDVAIANRSSPDYSCSLVARARSVP